jgi:hypothetical protein
MGMNKQLLQALFEYIIPSSQKLDMPSAAFIALSNIRFNDEDIQVFRNAINEITEITYSQFNSTRLQYDKMDQVLDHFKKNSKRLYNEVAFKVFNYYYTDVNILRKIGNNSVPLFPDGNVIPDDDLLIFEDVYLRGVIYRK